MKIDGSCQCGHITYEAEIDADRANICHCSDCQAFSGSAFRVGVPASSETFKLLSGTPKTYVKTAESGGKRAQVFCPECGTHIYAGPADAADGPHEYRIRIGSIRQRHEISPATQIWCRSALPWARDISGIPSRDMQ
jgi:hypothetical protein